MDNVQQEWTRCLQWKSYISCDRHFGKRKILNEYDELPVNGCVWLESLVFWWVDVGVSENRALSVFRTEEISFGRD